jgi:SAM-dependent methyltransferase
MTHLNQEPQLITPIPTARSADAVPSTSSHARPQSQRFLNGEVHDWYRIVLGFTDRLVAELLNEFQVKAGELVLDPFCGTGTTLVECMKRQIRSVGIDANPSSVFAARAKTNWSLHDTTLLELLEEVKRLTKRRFLRQKTVYKQDQTYAYLSDSGMIKRGWISREPLRKAIAIKNSIATLQAEAQYKNALTLSLIAEVVGRASNVKFGPELYCGPRKKDADVLEGFQLRVQAMAKDLNTVAQQPRAAATVLEDDARDAGAALKAGAAPGPYCALICSPPYPAEHDYTRNSRLELAFLEAVTDLQSLRGYKKRQLRSHTKGIYKEDNDSQHVAGHPAVERVAIEIEANVQDKTHGFAKLYSRVVREYFGGMKRHLRSVTRVLAPGARCAYVLGDQSAYAGVHIPTAEILAEIATDCGYQVLGIRPWRVRWSTTNSTSIQENILLLNKA